MTKTPNINVKELASSLNLSERQLRRIIGEELGFSTKDFLKVTRFSRAFKRISQGDYRSLSIMAQEAGYYDQAHFNHEFKRFTNQNPSQFIQYLQGDKLASNVLEVNLFELFE
ncbi:MAG: AraC family transcriptional regulator [Bacteroidota bacterium]